MSKSVDETVFDFFELLLHEDDGSPAIVSPAEKPHSLASIKENEAELLDAAILAEHNRSKPQPSVAVAAEVQVAKSKEHHFSMPLSEPSPQVNKEALEKLLAPVFKSPTLGASTVVEVSEVAKPEVSSDHLSEDAAPLVSAPTTAQHQPPIADTISAPETQAGIAAPSITKDLQEVLDDEFQVLFFKVAGLTLAVPLVSLGGIVKVERINHIIGRPSWFLGVQTHREEQLNIVDTCAWVMPEKYTDTLVQSVNYQYLVLLEGSNWGLTCESLVNAVKINKSQVNWRSKAGKRPWLAGVVKEQMCGILHVQALVEMLDAGLGCQDSIG
ncbi:chemotaxis protein CheW [Shewanella sp. HN-41]|uniref:chemotaxis protein CheW n=1 Tax=Shewanella sp. HN-41 TaxID=327275 RepID=UPI0002126057|nr:chemotaxis protein CheW [Shewanella sp. HN-41]EGM69265.1 CheW domain protein [Shewanella sp. HN-41]